MMNDERHGISSRNVGELTLHESCTHLVVVHLVLNLSDRLDREIIWRKILNVGYLLLIIV